MSKAFFIEADWERLESKVPEERACFAAIGIRHHDLWLTEAEDAFVNRVRQKVHLSAYKLAEWLAWNWWRLRWEPRRRSVNWAMSHRMATIGGGYVWPNLTIISDGERVLIDAQPTHSIPSEPLRYISSVVAVVRATDFEAGIDLFVEQVRDQLLAQKVLASNLDEIWRGILAERHDPELARSRRFEALLGSDPDEADPKIIKRLIHDSADLGEQSVAELAADESYLGSRELRKLAQEAGVSTNPKDAAKLRLDNVPALPAGIAAWKRGAETAQALRLQEGLGATPLSDERLCQLAGVSRTVLSPEPRRLTSPLSFALEENENHGHITLRATRETGRRFDLARLIGDRLTAAGTDRLYPVTRAHTYRQKLQRSFAAEFLCPFEQLLDFLKGDFSDEAIDEAAGHFSVSDLAVRTLLVNHKQLDRQELEEDARLSAA